METLKGREKGTFNGSLDPIKICPRPLTNDVHKNVSLTLSLYTKIMMHCPLNPLTTSHHYLNHSDRFPSLPQTMSQSSQCGEASLSP